MSAYDDNLIGSFRECAAFWCEPPEKPLKENSTDVVQSEMLAQLMGAMLELLSVNYGFQKDIADDTLQIGYACSQNPDHTDHLIYLACDDEKDASLSRFTEWRKKAATFRKDILTCTTYLTDCDEDFETVAVLPTEDLELVKIHLTNIEDLRKVLNIMADGLENGAALSHIRTANHLQERLSMGGPGRRMI